METEVINLNQGNELLNMTESVSEEKFERIKKDLEDDDGIIVFHTENLPPAGFIIQEPDIETIVQRAKTINVSVFYLLEERDEEGNLEVAGISFIHNDRAHTQYITKIEEKEVMEGADVVGEKSNTASWGFGVEESEEEKTRKNEIADEILGDYEKYLSEDERFGLENRLDRMSLRRLLQLQERVKQEDSVDPEEEKRLAQAVYEDERFNKQFNEMDTEMLLGELDVSYNPNNIRINEVHKRAKSLLKINR